MKKTKINIEFIDHKDEKTQLDVKQTFEKALMYMNVIDFEELPEPISTELTQLLVAIRETAWSIT